MPLVRSRWIGRVVREELDGVSRVRGRGQRSDDGRRGTHIRRGSDHRRGLIVVALAAVEVDPELFIVVDRIREHRNAGARHSNAAEEECVLETVVGDNVGRARGRASDSHVRDRHVNTGRAVAHRDRASGIDADVVPLDGHRAVTIGERVDPVALIVDDHVALAGRGAADQEIVRRPDRDSVPVIAHHLRPGDVGADVIALDGPPDGRKQGVDSMTTVVRYDIPGGGGGTSDDDVRRSTDENAVPTVAQRLGAGGVDPHEVALDGDPGGANHEGVNAIGLVSGDHIPRAGGRAANQ